MDDHLHAALCCDRNVADGLAAVLASASRKLARNFVLQVHVLDCGLGEDIRTRLQEVFGRRPNLRLEFIRIEPEMLDSFPLAQFLVYVSAAANARMLLHELLPALDRIVYLDCDLLVGLDLSRLQAVSIGDKPLAAVVDTVIPNVGHPLESLAGEMPELDPAREYFNSGVMILNLAELRRMGAGSLYAKAIRRIAARYGDQSILNAAFNGQWEKLPRHWNSQKQLGRTFNRYRHRPDAIWHFSSKIKPWHFHPQGARGLVRAWWRELALAGWEPAGKPMLRCSHSIARDLLKGITRYRKFRRWD